MELAAICGLPEGPRRTAALAAWVQGLFLVGEPTPVLVGGAAVELYTGGAYVTGDLDFVGEVPPRVGARLRLEGFRRVGRHWVHEEYQVFLEFPSRVLEPGAERALLSVGKVTITTLRPEDLIADRLRSLVYWRHREDGLNAFRIAWAQKSVLDPRRLEAIAGESEIRPVLQSLLALVSRKGPKPTAAQLRRWLDGVVS